VHVVCLTDLSGAVSPTVETDDLLVVGGGAAGLATAIFAARHQPRLRVRILDSAPRLGAKILVSGGSRCNVTNRIVTERDFWGGSRRFVSHVLRAFPADRAAELFTAIGVSLHEEEDGKLFPDSNRSRTVLDALLAEATRLQVTIETSQRVNNVRADSDGGRRFAVSTDQQRTYEARALVLATGGRSLPKSGSNGFGYALAASLGHSIVDTTPALAPLILDGVAHAALSGIALPVSLTLLAGVERLVSLEGALLWTHFGASGPVVLNVSRHWHRAQLEGRSVRLLVNVCPGESFESLESWWRREERARPTALARTVLATRLPLAVALSWLERAGIAADLTMAHVSRESRRALIHGLVESELVVRDSRGYSYAEVTAGGVRLDEVDSATMESRICGGLYLTGEILDVDGRLGGFNFQWAWSSGYVAGCAIARATASAVTRK
jgi:predicted Rossmann fold flavoprotein